MTTLEKWARESALQFGFGVRNPEDYVMGFMDGYNKAVFHKNQPKEICPPGHNCPDCGTSIIEGVED